MSTNYNILEDKELLEHLGRALYECQRLEVTLAFVICDLRLLTGCIQGNDLLERLHKFQRSLRLKRTLGGLFKELRKLIKLGDEDERLLSEALEKRNEIVHGFFYKHWVAAITPLGRDVMLGDLKQSIGIISGAYGISEKIRNQLDARLK